VLKAPKVVSYNTDSIVTERFEVIDRYAPDELQKMLVISAEPGATNEIIFWYTSSRTESVYGVVHYLQNPDGTTYVVNSRDGGSGTIGENISITPLTGITGFEFAKATVNGTQKAADAQGNITAKLTKEGLLFELYYDRILYDYTIRYQDKDTGAKLHEEEVVTDGAMFGTVITEADIPQDKKHIIDNYEYVETSERLITSEEGTNIIVRYYEENSIRINYRIVDEKGNKRKVERKGKK
jgi:hypothetical protein